MAKVVLAMSGGVDSSVAAHLLVNQGHQIVGVFMRHGEKAAEACSIDGRMESSPVLPILQGRSDHKQGCCSAQDAADARTVADRLGIPFYSLNLEEEFGRIIDYFVEEYTVGRTPNPCVMCNNWIKFGKLYDYADSIGAQFVATGHYARLRENKSGIPTLHRGRDLSKDQSYVLAGIKKEYLSRMLLPIGDFEKTAIRSMASEIGLNVAEKKDSQEICFVNSGHHDQFVKQRRDDAINTAGNFISTDGTVLGQHQGIERFTIGQRKGLGIALGKPAFVVRIDPKTFDVVLGEKDDLGRDSLTADRLNWIADDSIPFEQAASVLAQIRYNSKAVSAKTLIKEDATFQVQFDNPARGVAPGQAVVLYRQLEQDPSSNEIGDQVLGGGWIVS